MKRAICIIATLDTKGDQVEYIKNLIESQGNETIIIDVGILGKPRFKPSFTKAEVARAAGSNLKEIIALQWELKAMETMTQGVCKIVKGLCFDDKLNGILSVGGSMGTSLALQVMKAVPIALPKLILSTIAYSPTITPAMVTPGLMMLPWVGGLWGINSLSRRSLETAAGAISGAANAYSGQHIAPKKLIAISGIGWSVNHYMKRLKPGLEERGYEVAMFHATGMGGRSLEQAIYEGSIAAVLDLAVGGELLNAFIGTAFSPGEHRLEAASKMMIPQILGIGNVEVFFWGADRPLPPKYRSRIVPRPHNYLLKQVRATKKEQAETGRIMAEKLNRGTGPMVVILSKGISSSKAPPVPEGALPLAKGNHRSIQGSKAFCASLKEHLKHEINVVEIDAHLSEPIFSKTVLSLFDEMMEAAQKN